MQDYTSKELIVNENRTATLRYITKVVVVVIGIVVNDHNQPQLCNGRGEPTTCYRWTGWVQVQNNRLRFKTFSELPIITDHFRGIYRIYLKLIMKNRKITTHKLLFNCYQPFHFNNSVTLFHVNLTLILQAESTHWQAFVRYGLSTLHNKFLVPPNMVA